MKNTKKKLNSQSKIVKASFSGSNITKYSGLNIVFFFLTVVFLFCNSIAFSQQTDNHLLRAVPATGTVTIDGRLNEWDLSGRILICPNLGYINDYSAHVAMMYDAQALYVGVDWVDKTPMVNNYDPITRVDQRFAFHSDCIQLHFKTDMFRNVFGWYFTKGNKPGAYAMNGINGFNDREIIFLDADALGITQNFQMKPDGKGYFQEMRIPWSAIVKSGRAYQPGESFNCMLDLVWGPESGKGWPINHMMDLAKPDAVHTGWFWEVGEIHGQVLLSPTGKLPATDATTQKPMVAPKRLLSGTIPIRFELPKEAKKFTVAIDDADKRRIRNLAGDFNPADYTIEMRGSNREIEVKWDGLDDRGKLVPVGIYSIRILWHEGLDVIYEMSFYNPGVPPWDTRDGSGNWMADHTSPSLVTAAGSGVAIASLGAEGGSALIVVGQNGRKIWGDKQGGAAMTADKQYIYIILDDTWSRAYGLARFKVADGTYAPYTINKKQEFPVSPQLLFNGINPGKIVSLAVHDDQLVMGINGNKLAVINANTAILRKLVDMPTPSKLAFSDDGLLYALIDGTVCVIDLAQEKTSPFLTPGVEKATALTIDHVGNILVADMGHDSQVKAFTPQNKLSYTVGKKGGRQLSGVFDPQGMMRVSSVAVDAQNQVWVTENWEYPRRVSVWGKDGKLIRDYIGNTGYSGYGSFLHDYDPTLAYWGPTEMKLNKKDGTWHVTRILWVPDVTKNQFFPVPTTSDNGIIVSSRVSGKEKVYLYTKGSNLPRTIYMERNGRFQPVASIGLAKYMDNRINKPDYQGPFTGIKPDDGIIWNDVNNDGSVSRDECIVVPKLYWEGGYNWGERIGSDLVIRLLGSKKDNCITEWHPVSFTADGAPVYSLDSRRLTQIQESGDMLPLPEENKLFILSHLGWGGTSAVRVFNTTTSKELWQYPSPNHGVHGSHVAPMPEPGRLIGGLKSLGTAYINEQVGRIFSIRGNLGQDFLFTSDGLFVGALFVDCRLPSDFLPQREADLRGKSVANFTLRGEPFDGWFGSQSDDKVRMVGSLGGQGAMIFQVKGLDKIRTSNLPPLSVDAGQLSASERDNTLRATSVDNAKNYTIKRIPRKLLIDGNEDDWMGISSMAIGRENSPNVGTARIAYDADNLYLLYRIQDSNPWLNEGKDFTRLFKTGDAVDLQIGTELKPHNNPLSGDQRLVIALYDGKPTVVQMCPIDTHATPDAHVKYHSPVGEKNFDRVEIMATAKVAVTRGVGIYTVEAVIPLKGLGFTLKQGLKLRGDVGIISSDATGLINIARNYWAQPSTNLVSDLPIESWLSPKGWGDFVVE